MPELMSVAQKPAVAARLSGLFPDRAAWLRKLLSFAGIGLIATAIQYGVLIAAVEGLAANPVAGSSVGFVVSAVINYLLNYHLTFKSTRSHMSAASRFALIAVAGLLLNGLIMAACMQWVRIPYLVAQLVATALVFLLTFLGNALWSFKDQGAGTAASGPEGSK